MNLFQKQQQANLFFDEKDLLNGVDTLIESIDEIISVIQPDSFVFFKLHSIEDIRLDTLAVLMAYSKKLRALGHTVSILGEEVFINNLKQLNTENIFDAIERK